jgi:hypothetical protein
MGRGEFGTESEKSAYTFEIGMVGGKVDERFFSSWDYSFGIFCWAVETECWLTSVEFGFFGNGFEVVETEC